jgi:hypothetical protein
MHRFESLAQRVHLRVIGLKGSVAWYADVQLQASELACRKRLQDSCAVEPCCCQLAGGDVQAA